MSDLPTPPKKRAAPSMLDRNRMDESELAAKDALSLDVEPDQPTTKLSMAPIRVSSMQAFDRIYLHLKHQRHSLKRYEVMQALMDEFVESPDVQAAVVRRLRR